jgi:Golgi nucleoside diphosphatase
LQIKPGVSCFSKTPELAAENVRELLLVAKKQIPEELWQKTPLTFKATAGVRLLLEKEADAILSHVSSFPFIFMVKLPDKTRQPEGDNIN